MILIIFCRNKHLRWDWVKGAANGEDREDFPGGAASTSNVLKVTESNSIPLLQIMYKVLLVRFILALLVDE